MKSEDVTILTADEWLTLKEASELLAVHPATLRGWADKGQVPVVRTPGGHRRFRRSDVEQVLQPEQPNAAVIPASTGYSADLAIAHVRQDLSHLGFFQGADMVTLSDRERLICRDVGRQLVHLAIQYIARRNGHELVLDQAAEIGRTYGELFAHRGYGLSNTVRAFSLFREAVLDALCPINTAVHANDEEAIRIRREVRRFFDMPFYALLDAYDRSCTTWHE